MFIRKTNDPQGGFNFDPRAIIWTLLKEVHQTMFRVKYLSSSLYGSRWEDFNFFFFQLPWQSEFCMELPSFIKFAQVIYDGRSNFSGLWASFKRHFIVFTYTCVASFLGIVSWENNSWWSFVNDYCWLFIN